MDRLFLDANVLFSASYRPESIVNSLWCLPKVKLLSSQYAVDEVRRNVTDDDQGRRLDALLGSVELIADSEAADTPQGLTLPEKDQPIFIAAMAAGATHLLTGDWAHFGPYFQQRVGGVLIQPPAEYLRSRSDWPPIS